jgi:hypothetical protein
MHRCTLKSCLALAALLPCLATACAKTHVLNSNLTRDTLNARVTENFHKGMTYQEVNSKLTDLNVSENVRRTYSPTPPREMLVRLLPPGGAWVDQHDQVIEWWDLTFTFDKQDRLTAARAFSGGARYIDGFAANIQPPLPEGTRIRYPQPVPPPPTPPPGQPIPLH